MKKLYIVPETTIEKVEIETLLLDASLGGIDGFEGDEGEANKRMQEEMILMDDMLLLRSLF